VHYQRLYVQSRSLRVRRVVEQQTQPDASMPELRKTGNENSNELGEGRHFLPEW
jgi:hypothetical protein